MTNQLNTISPDVIASIVLNGDLSKLSPTQKVELYNYRCHQAGLDPSAKPFDLLTLNNKQILYANAAATQQLTATRSLSHQVTNRELVDGIYCVFVRVTGHDGRSTENMGAVPVEGLKGEAKANAMLKATTKAIRRAVLAHCGLGMMDETEVETIPGATKTSLSTLSGEVVDQGPGVINGWTIEAQEQFAILSDRIYTSFRDAGKIDKYADDAEKWRKRMASDTAENVLIPMAKFLDKLTEAADKKPKSSSNSDDRITRDDSGEAIPGLSTTAA